MGLAPSPWPPQPLLGQQGGHFQGPGSVQPWALGSSEETEREVERCWFAIWLLYLEDGERPKKKTGPSRLAGGRRVLMPSDA